MAMNAPRMQMENKGTNRARRARILLLGDPLLISYFRLVLEKLGCECSIAKPNGDLATVDIGNFDLVVSAIPGEREEALLSSLAGRGCTVYACRQLDDGGYGWFPIMVDGETCIKAQVLNPTDFIAYINQIAASLSEER